MCSAYYKDEFFSGDPEQPEVIEWCEAIRAAEWECNARFEFVPRTFEEACQIPCLHITSVNDEIPF